MEDTARKVRQINGIRFGVTECDSNGTVFIGPTSMRGSYGGSGYLSAHQVIALYQKLGMPHRIHDDPTGSVYCLEYPQEVLSK